LLTRRPVEIDDAQTSACSLAAPPISKPELPEAAGTRDDIAGIWSRHQRQLQSGKLVV